ncbi:HAD family hydrolase [Aeromonas piscicola]|jgi:beta-phosphoglucomutase family hydrolase|uniref:Beta-phosphoglucomutase family hydrolase n=1 Tax=Aeromonas piscicola TaxID=600645 RepID=A0ABT7QFB6_9GAMM|nr:beta-phosphoglucomutase family hydrolase [Aeromonas piscicola]MCW0505220.1 beta-phosphoglucomutase family hydrolase [Aeromonas piscicola]MDM5132518.1 beta-phosphoglucomutase family hydrolase [Aeromonas piscicola]
MTLSGFQGLVFDLDGTLVDSMPLHLAAWAHTAREFGFHFDADWFYELGGMPSRKIALLVAEQQQIALDPLVVTRCKTDHYVANLHKVTVFPAMLELVQRHHGLLPMGIGTGSPRVNAEAVLRNTGLDRYFPVVVTADDVDLHKPHPDTFLLAARRLGVEPATCLVFEDTGIGVQAGQAAGMQTCMVRDGKPVDLQY